MGQNPRLPANKSATILTQLKDLVTILGGRWVVTGIFAGARRIGRFSSLDPPGLNTSTTGTGRCL
jgi:hypothetical protein